MWGRNRGIETFSKSILCADATKLAAPSGCSVARRGRASVSATGKVARAGRPGLRSASGTGETVLQERSRLRQLPRAGGPQRLAYRRIPTFANPCPFRLVVGRNQIDRSHPDRLARSHARRRQLGIG